VHNQKFDFLAMGDQLISQTAQAMSMAQDSPFDDETVPLGAETKLRFTPYPLKKAHSRNGLPCIRLLLDRGDVGLNGVDYGRPITVSSNSDPEKLAERLHRIYLTNEDRFMLRCIGSTSSTAIRSLAHFNEKIVSHRLAGWLSSELIRDTRAGPDFKKNTRVLLFHVDVVGAEVALVPPNSDSII